VEPPAARAVAYLGAFRQAHCLVDELGVRAGAQVVERGDDELLAVERVAVGLRLEQLPQRQRH